LATIFSFEKSRKWIIREGPKGISRSGSGAPIASGLKKSRGFRKWLLVVVGEAAAKSSAVLTPEAAANVRSPVDGGERDTTQDWLVPDEPSGAPGEPPLRISAVGQERQGNGRPQPAAALESDQREALRIAASAADSAQSSAATALAAAEIADDSSIRVQRAEGRVEQVALRAEGVLARIEARERAAERRAAEAVREDEALQAIATRADRILERLRRLAA
jgi:hypothetical protein